MKKSTLTLLFIIPTFIAFAQDSSDIPPVESISKLMHPSRELVFLMTRN